MLCRLLILAGIKPHSYESNGHVNDLTHLPAAQTRDQGCDGSSMSSRAVIGAIACVMLCVGLVDGQDLR